MLNIIVYKKDIVKVFDNDILVGYVEHKGDYRRELSASSKDYKVIVNSDVPQK